MATISGNFSVDGIARNGATAKLWSSGAAFLTNPPQKGTALPLTGSPLQTTTTGTTHGGDGAYRFTGVTTGLYYVSIEWNSTVYYDSPTNIVASGITSVKDYGALGDGVTDDTTAIQAGLNDTANGFLYFPPGTYKSQALTITNRTGLVVEGQGATLSFTGTGSDTAPKALKLAGANVDITIRHMRFVGDGVAASYHMGIFVPTGVSFEGLRVQDCRFESLAAGIYMDRATGTWLNLLIEGCQFKTIVGTGTAQGLGIRLKNTATTALQIAIRNNDFYSTDTGAIHVLQGNDVTIEGNHSLLHRTNTLTGLVVAAILIRQCRDVLIKGNVIDTYSDGAISIQPASGVQTRGIVIEGNRLSNANNPVQDINVGSATPAADGTTQDLQIIGNSIYKTGIDVDAILIQSALRAVVANNLIDMQAIASGTRTGISLSGAGETSGPGTRTYSDQLVVAHNLLYATAAGGTFAGIALGSAFCTSAIRAEFRGNRNAIGNMFFGGATLTNDDTLRVIDQADDGLTYATATELAFTETGPIQLIGAIQNPILSLSADFTLTQHHRFVVVDASGGSVTVTIPQASAAPGREYFIVRTDSSLATVVTLLRTGADTFNGLTSRFLVSQYEAIRIVSDGVSAWRIVGGYGNQGPQQVRTLSGTQTLDHSDRFIRADTSGGNVVLNLPPLATAFGQEITVVRSSSTANSITLDPNGAETIDGGATVVLAAAGSTLGNFITIANNGATWYTVMKWIT